MPANGRWDLIRRLKVKESQTNGLAVANRSEAERRKDERASARTHGRTERWGEGRSTHGSGLHTRRSFSLYRCLNCF